MRAATAASRPVGQRQQRAHCVSPNVPLHALAASKILRQRKIGAAAQRENQPLEQSAARIKGRIHRLRTDGPFTGFALITALVFCHL